MSSTLKRIVIGFFIVAIFVGIFAFDFWLETISRWKGHYPSSWGIVLLSLIISGITAYEILAMMKTRDTKVMLKTTIFGIFIFLIGAIVVSHIALHKKEIHERASQLSEEDWKLVRSSSLDEKAAENREFIIDEVLKRQASLSWLLLFGVGFAFTMLVWVRGLWRGGSTDEEHRLRFQSIMTTTFVFWLIGFPYAFGVFLRMMPAFGLRIIIFTVVVGRFGDIGAFFFGKLFGKHKLIPNVSPKKTIEGSIGGILSSAAIGAFLTYLFDLQIFFRTEHWYSGAIVGAIIGAVSQIADLLSSAIKRWARAKDSGSLVPEFGGMLDLCDNFLLSLPTMYLITIFLWIR